MDVFGLAALSKVNTVGSSVSTLAAAVEDLEAGSLSALDAAEGQVPVADGEGSWEWGSPTGGTITDVQINGTSIVSGGVANVPVAEGNKLGVVMTKNADLYGIVIGSDGNIATAPPSSGNYKAGSATNKPVCVAKQHESTFYALAKAAGADMKDIASTTVGTYPAAQKSAISTMLHAPETVTGTTPAITALPGVRYVCGEVATLDITLPASGCVDVRFESGSTPTVLTITPPTGVTVKWAGGFDPTALEANTVYEINIADGLGVAASWT